MTPTPFAPPANDVAPGPPAAFTPMTPLEVAKARAGLSKRDGAVLRELTLMADRNGHTSAAQTEIATACRMSERSVRDAVKSLELGGWITRAPVNTGKGGRANDRYTVHAAPVLPAVRVLG